MGRALAILLLALIMISPCLIFAHNTGVPHREFTAEELRELGLEELIEGQATTSSVAASSASNVDSYTLPHGPLSFHELLRSWPTDPGVLLSLGLTAILYAMGVRRLWNATHTGAAISKGEVGYFTFGWFWLAVALVSPLHPWGEVLFSAHMVQHEILMLLAAPLLIIGRPMLAFLWALPRRWRRYIGRFFSSAPVAGAWQFLINPFVAWIVHGVALWIWHIPSWFMATLTSDWIHSLQHMSFFVSALLFWFAVLDGHYRKLGYGMAVVYLFTTAVHSGALGALLTFSTQAWYPAYETTAKFWGLSLIEDQQLGGLIMWIPAGLIYIGSGLVLFLAWLNEAERRTRLQETEWLLRRNSAVDTSVAVVLPKDEGVV